MKGVILALVLFQHMEVKSFPPFSLVISSAYWRGTPGGTCWHIVKVGWESGVYNP